MSSKCKQTRKKAVQTTVQVHHTICSPGMKIENIWKQPGDTLTLRHQQIDEIKRQTNKMFVDKSVKTNLRGLLVVGPPGTGKTSSLRYLTDHWHKDNYRVLCINSHITWKYKQLITTIKQQLTNSMKGLLIYIEQFDYIIENNSNGNDLLTDFLEIFTIGSKSISHTVFIGLSNKLDLSQLITQKTGFKIGSVVFAPYDQSQITEIIRYKIKRVEELTERKVEISQKIVNFISNKIIEEKRGDIRIVIEFLKILFAPFLRVQYSKQSIVIKIDMVTEILSKVRKNNESILSKLPIKPQIVLLGLYLFIKRTEALEVGLLELDKQVRQIYKLVKLKSTDQIYDSIDDLSNYGCINIRKKGHKDRKVTLRKSLEQIEEVISANEMLKHFLPQKQLKQ